MRSAAEIVAEAGADLIDINMGCPVRKVCKTGAGAAMLSDHDLAVRIASAAREGGGIPVTVKLRSGLSPVAARASSWLCGWPKRRVSPRSVSIPGRLPPSTRAAGLRARAGAGRPARRPGDHLRRARHAPEAALHAYEASGADAVMIARGSLGNPWIFEQLTGDRSADPKRDEVIAELLWVIDRAEEHLGPERAARYLRKFYPWYLERLGADKEIADALQQSETLDGARDLVSGLALPPAAVPA